MSINNCTELPQDYHLLTKVDLLNNKTQAVIVNVLAVVIAVAMVLVAILWIEPIDSLFDMSKGFGMYLLRFGVILLSLLVYVLLHELIHGILMQYYSKTKPFYGFKGMYAYAGSNAYFNKISYIVIALAPIVVLGVVLLVLNILVTSEWFWVVYLVQIMNVSGAAGDMYVTAKFVRLPKDILIQDAGVSMTIFAQE